MINNSEMLSDIIQKLEDSIDFEDWNLVKEVVDDLNILYEDMIREYSDLPSFDEDYE